MDSRQQLAALIAAEHPEPYREDLRTITGARSDLEIAEWIDELVRQELGCGTAGALFAGKSVGAVFGLELTSGERVVLKLFHPMFPPAELQAMQRCLEGLVARGFPRHRRARRCSGRTIASPVGSMRIAMASSRTATPRTSGESWRGHWRRWRG